MQASHGVALSLKEKRKSQTHSGQIAPLTYKRVKLLMKLQYLLGLSLTFILSSYIIYKGRKVKTFPSIAYSQSSIHLMIKDFLPKTLYEKPRQPSQSLKHVEKNTIKVIFIEGKAYWVSNNIFYSADALNGNVNIDTTEPIDTTNMSKKDIDKMLFILDNLKNGSNDDNSSAGNERF